jgi:ribosome maturation factor RimP
VLEVSSPGVDRPLTEPRHWRRSVGRLVTVPVAGEGRRTGRVVAAAASGVTLEVDGVPRELGYGQLGPGRVQVELRRLEEASEESSREEGEREH